MRGAFSLKPRSSYVPLPGYALVNDPARVIEPNRDLDAEALLRLYGRPFGAPASAS